MKNIINNKIAGLFAAAAMLFATTSCVKDNVADPMQGAGIEVSFTLAPEGAAADTRLAYPTPPRISDGTKANILIYAVYDESGNLLANYGEGDLTGNNLELGEGQTAKNVEKYPTEVKIRFAKSGTYKVAFWAQSEKCNAYNTKNLKQVEVIYSNIIDDSTVTGTDAKTSTPNNDEYRDAFCRVVDLTVGDFGNVNRNVNLYRPLAQINVGTAGYDYEIITRGANSKKYTYSRIQLGYEARYLDVVNDKVLRSTVLENPEDLRAEARSYIDFGYARIPAYINYLDKTDAELAEISNEDGVKLYPSYRLENEEFLKVDLNRDGQVTPYVGLDKYVENPKGNDNYTETFKYLSMCYVLVDSQTVKENADPDDKDRNKYALTTLDNVIVYMATDENGTDEIEIVNLNNVPVQRNWRTNIISQNLLTADAKLIVDICPIYDGDYNNVDDKWQTIIYDGVSYDPQKDEIVISNANGLIWLSRMVNGEYSHEVLDDSGEPETFSSKGIVDPTIGDNSPEAALLKETILHATHQDMNQNYDAEKNNWPEKNRFHFMGTKDGKAYPAKVRLAEDIDMTGVEWIPIGFAANIGDTYDFFSDKYAEHIGFCGEFDGDGHTIRNITNKKFSANVHESAYQQQYYKPTGITEYLYHQNGNYGPYNCPQWSPVGLFGQIAESASVHDVRLYNVDFFGYHCAGAITGIATGDNIEIKNCYVDSGTVTLSPMYRGDDPRTTGRTFARGIYLGGIVGHYNAKGSVVGCDVRNVVIHGYRNVGGLIGSIKNTSEIIVTSPTLDEDKNKNRIPKDISKNGLHNVIILADKFQVYDYYWHRYPDKDKDKGTGEALNTYKNGFGWNVGQGVLADVFIGGYDGTDAKFCNPANYSLGVADNVTFTAFATSATGASTKRESEISTVPLEYMPLLSSWFVDEITFTGNFSGSHSAYKTLNMHDFAINSKEKDKKYKVPFNLPYELNPDFDTNSGRVGLYVESVTLDGTGNTLSNRTIVTIDDVKGENDCVMYITSRDKSEFEGDVSDVKILNSSTVVKSLTLRGDPYAYAGICLAPNKYTSEIKLENIAIYDVYKTLELDPKLASGANAGVTLNVTADDDKTSNLRGYTECGSGWNNVKFYRTVFERGANTGHGDKEYTCKVESPTTFNTCWFKAPYIIEIADGVKIDPDKPMFTNTFATSASSKTITLEAVEGCTEIVISDNGKGDVVVEYKKGDETLKTDK